MATYTRVPGAPTDTPVQAPATGFRGFLSRLSEAAQSAVAQQKPWGEVFDRHAFGKPDSLADASGRIRKNVSYFRVNYFICLLGLILLSLLWHPGSFFVVALLLVAWAFFFVYRTQPLVIFNRTFSDIEVLGLMGLLTVVVVFLLTDAGSLLISTVVFGFLVICAHAAFRVPDDLFLDEQQSSGGFLSFLGGSVPQPAVSSVSRV
ncbi:hypothetical protein O6H91_17G079100 [Diphasiastrum complanatum]|uniref:Uncharacterized protein n=3 Tax=Diphasiastrum complanatum TaxID=34168 RepID=A0ACC2B8K1_DIPCM|nr:hypothetical protein O6H91_Y209000 [Diphasiastrum complanatum]KAJ7526042.1 hypothetical protein O6H91_17G079100 [Diphasiastrum complanatum]KAJ7526043.1 hypothetical protein O6H91_17G079100 [Diphasiastrum complanatum]KAJ7526044.1 hypothetical protein O6H91_17G079100 [Diphasiastrum complanatum]